VDGMTIRLSFEKVECYNLTGDYPLIATDWPVLTAGTSNSNPLPLQSAPLVLFRTATKRSVGRKYIPGFCADANDGAGVLLETYKPLLLDFAEHFLAGMSQGDVTGEFGNYRPSTTTFVTWIEGDVDDIIRTQRRRVLGVGA